MPGFHHLVDNILKHICNHLKAFPLFLEQLKAIVKLLRFANHVEVLEEVSKASRRLDLAKAIQKFGTVSFAKWRWHTLRECVLKVLSVRDLKIIWDPTLFSGAQESMP